jgi:hypothetical protein
MNDQKLERASIRLDGLEVYAVVGALQAGTSVAMMQEITIGNGGEPLSMTLDNMLSGGFLLCGTAASLGGIYATIMFALCSLYGKTALGLNKDDMYDYFMKKTGPHRFRAFNAFTTSLLLFCMQVVILFALKCPGSFRIPVCIIIGVIIWLGRRDTNALISAATPIFTGVIPDEDRPKPAINIKPEPPPPRMKTGSSNKRD